LSLRGAKRRGNPVYARFFTRLLRLKSRNDWYRKKFPIYIIPSKVKIYATWWEKKWKKSVFFIWLIISKNPIKNIPSLWKEFVLSATMIYFQRMFVVTKLNICILVCVFFVILFHSLLQMHTKYHKCNLVCKLSFFLEQFVWIIHTKSYIYILVCIFFVSKKK